MSFAIGGLPVPAHPTDASPVQSLADTAMDDAGRSVVAWYEDDGNSGPRSIRARLFGATGIAGDDSFRVDTGAWNVNGPVVAMDADGDFAVAWVADVATPAGFDFALVGRRFDAAGTPRGPEFRVDDESPAGHPGVGGNAYDVALSGAGELIVAWIEQSNTSGGNADIYVRRYSPEGQVRGPAVRVAPIPGGVNAGAVAVSAGAGGNFTVAWRATDFDDPTDPPRSDGIYARRFDASGRPAGAASAVSASTGGRRYGPLSVSIDGVDHSVIAWRDDRGVRARRFDAAGAAAGAEVSVVNEPAEASAQVPIELVLAGGTVHVGSDEQGRFLVGWTSLFESGSQPRPAFVRQYDAAGTPLMEPITVPSGDQEMTGLAVAPRGFTALAVWSSKPPVDVYCQFFFEGPIPPPNPFPPPNPIPGFPPPPPPPPPPNTAPTTSGLPDLVRDTDDDAYTLVPLFPAFADAEDPDAALTYVVSVANTTNPGLFKVLVVDPREGGLTIITSKEPGQATLIVTATDSGNRTVQTAFNVSVHELPKPPVPVPLPSPPQVGAGPGAPGTVRGLLFNDADGNGKRSRREPGLAGVTVFIDSNASGWFDVGEPAVATNAKGAYAFTGVPDGPRQVRVYMPEGLHATRQQAAEALVAGPRGATVKPIGLRAAGGIAGGVFTDYVYQDGYKQYDDKSLRGVRVFLDANGDGVWQKRTEASTRSDRFGRYAITGLAAGSYRVGVVTGRKLRTTAPTTDPLVIDATAWAVTRHFGLVARTTPRAGPPGQGSGGVISTT